VRIIAPYDDVTDSKITELNEKIVLQLTKWERVSAADPKSAKLAYVNNADFYDEVNTTLDILIARNNAIEQNKIVNEQLKNADNLISDMELLHKTENGMGMNVNTIKLVKANVQVSFGAIQKLQMELKRGEDLDKKSK
jgi:hypothetical protein